MAYDGVPPRFVKDVVSAYTGQTVLHLDDLNVKDSTISIGTVVINTAEADAIRSSLPSSSNGMIGSLRSIAAASVHGASQDSAGSASGAGRSASTKAAVASRGDVDRRKLPPVRERIQTWDGHVVDEERARAKRSGSFTDVGSGLHYGPDAGDKPQSATSATPPAATPPRARLVPRGSVQTDYAGVITHPPAIVTTAANADRFFLYSRDYHERARPD